MTNLEKWNYYLRDIESPQQYIDWTYLWTVSSALQRRVYLSDPAWAIFPNMFVIFVADPGIGKSLAARVSGSQILKTFTHADAQKVDKDGKPLMIHDISFSADCTTPQSLIQQLGASTRISIGKKLLPGTDEMVPWPEQHNSMSILLSEEMTSMFRTNMEDMASFLNQWWDAQDFEYKTKHNGEDTIKNVCVSLLGCTTPLAMKKLIATGILDGGFTARALFIYGEAHRHRKLMFEFNDDQKAKFAEVRTHIKSLLNVSGPCKLSDEAHKWFKDYYESGALNNEIRNKDIKLQHYGGRIKIHVLKVATALHYGESTDMVIQLPTVKRAITFLRDIEPNMHKAMASTAKNPIYETAQSMLNFLRYKGPHSKLQLKIIFSSEGDDSHLEGAITILMNGEKIERDVMNGKEVYKLKPEKKEELKLADASLMTDKEKMELALKSMKM